MTLRQRQRPHRDRAYLDLAYAPGVVCLRCGATPCEPCHYSGYLAHKVGKSGACKSADAVSAHLCRACHVALDTYTEGNDAERAAQFLMLCWQTLLRNLDTGRASLNVNVLVRDAQHATSASTESVSASRASEKSLPLRLRRTPKRISRKTGHFNGGSTRRPSKSYHPEGT